ncbi:hypothetical protein [Francisella philomiragia]|uniref:hypothetical protein n=1 Tax=Francisella philomiragia TaxID=28110 RepID=UPI001B8BF152|nr:hypothetical protein [Francisella philomiragia]QUE32426.1 hypothetical protein IMS64_09540 [Francisella philomiragia]
MHHKKTISFLAFLMLAGCSSHDEEYYKNHIDEAKTKYKECNEALNSAFMSSDKNKYEKTLKNPECIAADKAVKDYEQKLAEARKQEAEKKYKEEYSKSSVLFEKMSYKDFFNYKKNCSLYGGYMSTGTTECKAYFDLQSQKESEEIANINNKYSGEALIKFKEESCKGSNVNTMNDAYCYISNKALEGQMKEKVSYYIAHKDELKKDFNECQKEYVTLKKQKGYSEAYKYLSTFKCDTAGKAAREYGVYNFDRPVA